MSRKHERVQMPYIKDRATVDTIMLDVLVALTPALVMGAFLFGFRVLVLAAISVLSCMGTEYLYCKWTKKAITIGDLSACVTGLLLAMTLPVTAPYWAPVLGGAFAIIVVKQFYGGLGKNFMNPALAGRMLPEVPEYILREAFRKRDVKINGQRAGMELRRDQHVILSRTRTDIPQAFVDHCAILFVRLRRAHTAAPHAHQRRAQFDSGLKAAFELFHIVAHAVIASVCAYLKAMPGAQFPHSARGVQIARRYMHVAAPFHSLQPCLHAKLAYLLRSLSPESNRHKSAGYHISSRQAIVASISAETCHLTLSPAAKRRYSSIIY